MSGATIEFRANFFASMPTVSDKAVYDLMPKLSSHTLLYDAQTGDKVGNEISQGLGNYGAEIYASKKAIDDNFFSSDDTEKVHTQQTHLKIGPRVKAILNTNRRYFRNGDANMYIGEREDFNKTLTEIIQDATQGSPHIKYPMDLTDIIDQGLIELDDDSPSILREALDETSVYTQIGELYSKKGGLQLQPYLRISRSPGYPTAAKINNETDEVKVNQLKRDLLYIKTISTRINWGKGEIPEIEFDPDTGALYLDGTSNSDSEYIKGKYWQLPLYEDDQVANPEDTDTFNFFVTGKDFELAVMFPFLEGPHNIARGQKLIAILMDSAQSEFIGHTNKLAEDYHGLGDRFKNYFNVSYGLRLVQIDPVDTTPQSERDIALSNAKVSSIRRMNDIGKGQAALEKVINGTNTDDGQKSNVNILRALRSENSYRCREIHEMRVNTLSLKEIHKPDGTIELAVEEEFIEDHTAFGMPQGAPVGKVAHTKVRHIYETPLVEVEVPVSGVDLDLFNAQLVFSRDSSMLNPGDDYFYSIDDQMTMYNTPSANALIEMTKCFSGHLARNFYNNNHLKKLRNKMIEQDEFKILFEYIYPVDRYLAMSTVYCVHSAEINFEYINEKFKKTKSLIIANYLSLMKGVGNIRFDNPEISVNIDDFLNSQLDSGKAATGGEPSDWPIIWRAVMLIVGAIARIESPGYAVAEQIYRLIGAFIPEDQYKPPYYPTLPSIAYMLQPSPPFPPAPIGAGNPLFPIKMFGLAYMFSGVVPETYKTWGVPVSSDRNSATQGQNQGEGQGDSGGDGCLYPPNSSQECKNAIDDLWAIVQQLGTSTPPDVIQNLALLQAGKGACAKYKLPDMDLEVNVLQTMQDQYDSATKPATGTGMSLSELAKEVSESENPIDLGLLTNKLLQNTDYQSDAPTEADSPPAYEDIEMGSGSEDFEF
jgi:hypothetical protein